MGWFFAFCAAVLAGPLPAWSSAPPLPARGKPSLVSSPGDRATIPGWHLQSTQDVDTDISALSVADVDVSDWHRMGSRGTVMAGLIESGVHDEATIFFSENLKLVDHAFNSPWLYREEFTLQPQPSQHYFVETHGISSRADIFINGELLVSKDEQVGSYGGQKYDVTEYVHSGANCILVQAYPTNYLQDLAMGFIDWNPYPPDNGTGVWRNIEFSQTGQIAIMSPIRVVTDFEDLEARTVKVTAKIDVRNAGDSSIDGRIEGEIQDGDTSIPLSKEVTLDANEERTVSIEAMIEEPKIWWPAFWGEQPLYNVNLAVHANDEISDTAVESAFGIRHVDSHLNSEEDVSFSVNGKPFLVVGAGYTSDMFLRLDMDRLKIQFQYMLDMGMNTVRLEGKQEHPELYSLADQMGMMVIAGWECCNKWEAWSYNNEAEGELWDDEDYRTAEVTMLHEADMMQIHPSMLAFLTGSDFWPNDRATKIYVDALNRKDWTNPIISSASKRGFPDLLGPSGMEMDGPYDWVPPNYWYGDQLGAAGGFGSELGAGVGTPELRSLKKFLSPDDLQDLWTQPDKDLFHMSRYDSQFADRSIYNEALYARYGEPSDLDDYLLKTQLMDFEATRAQFESYTARKSSERPSTGLIYWMLNGAWPNLHWCLFDYYMKPIASYFGTKVGSRVEHVAYDYQQQTVYIINHSLERDGPRTVSIDLIDINGDSLSQDELSAETAPNSSKQIGTVAGIDQISDVAFLKLVLKDGSGEVLSRNVYWLSSQEDVLDWDGSTWYHTPVTEHSSFSGLGDLSPASVETTVEAQPEGPDLKASVVLENTSEVPAFFVRLNILNVEADEEITPVFWSDNYVTLWPGEELELSVEFQESQCDGTVVEISGFNVEIATIDVC